jgi:hypothetical protein
MSNKLKVSSKLSRRTKRYMFGKRVGKMISTELAKSIQEEIDNQIVRMLKSMAVGMGGENIRVDQKNRPTFKDLNFNQTTIDNINW